MSKTNPWAQIDALKRKHDNEFEATKNALEAAGAVKESLEINEYGHWTCRHIPKGERRHVVLTAPSADQLVKQLKAAKAGSPAR